MTEKIRKVSEHGPPDPEQWVCWRRPNEAWCGPELLEWPPYPDTMEWYPTDPPPTEYVEDESVEVDGERYRKRFAAWVQRREGVHWLDYATIAEIRRVARVAAALGLVDQPTVPKALVDWLEGEALQDDKPGTEWAHGRKGLRDYLLDLIRAGEFGPVEWEWVTDRLPRDDDAPVIVRKRGTDNWSVMQKPSLAAMGALHDVEWVSLSSLLGDR